MHDFAVLCPGQGDQSSTMFDLVMSESDGAAALAACSIASGIDLVARARANDRLFENAYAQPAVVAQAIAAWTCLAPRLPRPALFAGYSVGEVSAWACASRWGVATAASVAGRRVEAMDRLGPPGCGVVAVRGLSRDEVERLGADLDVAIVNERDHFVLAGPDDAIDRSIVAFANQGARVHRLDVHVPSHTPSMRAAADAFATDLRALPVEDPIAPVLRGIDGIACRRGDQCVEALSRAVAQTIRWDVCMQALSESGVRVALELGPGRALARSCAVHCPDISVRSLSDFRSMSGVVAWMTRSLAG